MSLRVVVFKSRDEIDELKRLFYGPYDAQTKALALTKAYQVRGPIPPAIHLTALIVAAVHADVPENDLYAIRQTYSMGIIRLVNEILDSSQTGRVAAPLHALAREVELPSAFVELRHAATHEDLPSVYLLRDLAQRALQWLWDCYWSKNGTNSSAGTPTPASTPVPGKGGFSAKDVTSDEIKDLFRDWRRLRRTNLSGPIDGDAGAIANKLQLISLGAAPLFNEVLFKRNILIPSSAASDSGSSVSKKVTAAQALWGPLVVALGPGLDLLFEELVKLRNNQDFPADNTGAKYLAYQAWLEYLLQYVREPVDLLSSSPRPWNALLLAQLANTRPDMSPSSVYSLAEEMAAFTGTTLPPFTGPPPAEDADELPVKGPWHKVCGWTPRPIGEI